MATTVRVGGHWLGQLGTVGGLVYSSIWRSDGYCGDHEASWTWDADPNFTPPFAQRGARVEVKSSGVRTWHGVLDQPDRGRPWRMHAYGLGHQAAAYSAVIDDPAVPGTQYIPSTDAAAVLDAAFTRGMAGHRLPGDVFGVVATTDARIEYVSDLMLAAAKQAGKRWVVDPDGRHRFADDPGAPSWVMRPSDGIVGSADEDYYSHLVGYYVTSVDAGGTPTGWSTQVVGDDLAASRWGRREKVIDLTKLGVMVSGDVLAYLTARIGLVGARMGYSSAVEGTRDTFRHISWAQADLSAVRAGQMTRVHGVLDATGNLNVAGAVNLIGGRVEYRVDDGVVVVEPLGLEPRDLSGIVADPSPPEAVEAV